MEEAEVPHRCPPVRGPGSVPGLIRDLSWTGLKTQDRLSRVYVLSHIAVLLWFIAG